MPDEPLAENRFVVDEPLDELPEFEVVHTGDTREQPYWVERINTDTYHAQPGIEWLCHGPDINMVFDTFQLIF